MFLKHRQFWDIAVRNVRRFPGRALAIFVPLFVVMAFASVMTFLKNSITRNALEAVRSFPDITVSQFQGGRNIPPAPELGKEIAALANVRKVTPGSWRLEEIFSGGDAPGGVEDPGTEGYWDLGINLREPAYADQVAGDIFAAHKNVKAVTRDILAAQVRHEYGRRSGVFHLMWQILLLTALLTAWAQSSSINLEMRREIGVLKAIGWQTLDIIELKMLEILIIGLAGLLAGILSGIAYLYLGAPLVKEYFVGNNGVYATAVKPIYIGGSGLFLLFIIGIFPLCAATVVSAWRMGTVEPDDAIRGG